MSFSLTSRERVTRTFDRQEIDRVSVMDCLWSTTVTRWLSEGMPAGMPPEDYFGYDLSQLSADLSLMLPSEILEENEEYTIIRNSYGTTVKNFRHATSTPAWLGHSINNPDDWIKYRDRFKWVNDRIDLDGFRKRYDKARSENRFVVYTGAISWDAILQIIGPEALLTGFYDEPEWIHEMFEAASKLYIEGYKSLCGMGFDFDGGWVYDDMAYKGGLLFSPAIYKEFFYDRDTRVCSIFREQGKPVILHSCGNIKSVIPQLIKAGYSCLQPLEVKAGMDLTALQEEFGRDICFMGGMDAMVMSTNDRRLIEEEIGNKIRKAVNNGGYFYHSDHSVPDTVSFDTYKFILEVARKQGRPFNTCPWYAG